MKIVDVLYAITHQRQLSMHLLVLKDKIKISDAYKNSIIDTVILLTKKEIYKNRQKGKVTNIAEIRLSAQLQYEQYYVEIEDKLPIFEQKWSNLTHI